ncbi:response regulator, partial [Pseudomonas aeruginosa]|nr:response regulator [Pseudomonas aeruginosa]
LPAQLSGDPTRIRQVVSNLLSNALKFTRLGRVDVRVEATTDGVRISVRDTGIGIAQEALDRIFQPFTQADAGITRQYGGTGLGLALTRKLCEAMHGELMVESTVGLGSLFSVNLPLAQVSPPARAEPLRGRVIAQCSANSGLAELLQTWLPRWGLEYRRLDTDDSLVGHTLDVLISDCPDCLMGLRPRIGTPILLVTAYGSFLEPELARRLAPLRQVARPLGRNPLHQALRSVLEQASAPASPPSAGTAAQRDTRVLLVEDNPVNQLVAKGLLHKLGCQVWIAEHGLNALKLLEEQPIDMVLMDCNMPVMDGYEATRQIRDSGRWGGLPIIALTANALPEERERCRAAGMDDYLAKPFHRDELKAILDRWCPAARGNQAPPRHDD